MPNTPIYELWFADAGTETTKYPEKDRERWEALEIQLLELYTIFMNGVNESEGEGWRIDDTVAAGPIVYITPGQGHIYFKYAQTTEKYPISLLIPAGVDMENDGIRYYVYGYATETTHFDKSVTFEAFTIQQTNDSYIYLGSFLLKTNDSGYVIASKDYDGRDTISIFSSITKLINSHVHTGNPPKINLRKHTSGKLPGAFIDSSLDASQIATGKMSADRLPQISHTELTNNGVLTHAEIDTFYTNETIGVDDHLAEVAFSNWLQDVIARKALYINFDEYFLNSFFYIPGVTSNNYVDYAGTTALIDAINHQIVGIEAAPSTSDFITWNGESEFNTVYNANYAGKNEKLYVDSNGIMALDIPLLFTELYNTTDSETAPKHWDTYTEVTTVQSSSNETILIDAKLDYYRFFRFWSGTGPVTKDFSENGNNPVNKLQFGLKLVDPSVLEHGSIYFFLIGATHQTLPNKSIIYTDSINSNTYNISISGPIQILGATEQTTDSDDNIKVINIDLLQFVDRDNVQGFGFYISTDNDWNIINEYQFTLHQPPYADMAEQVSDDLKIRDPYSIPDEGTIVMYAYNDLYYEKSGKVYFRFSQPLMAEWDYVYWGVDLPTVPIGVTSPYLLVRTISAATTTALAEANPYLVSEITHVVASDSNKYIDVLVEFIASSDRRYSPELNYLTLYYTIASSINSKSFTTAAQFIKGLKQINVSILQNPDRIELANTDLVNALFFLEGNSIKVIDEDKEVVTSLSFDGSTIYESPRQIFAKAGGGFRKAKCLGILEEGFLIADTQNDRIVEIDFSGNLLYAIQGNVYLPKAARDFVALTANYNERLGKIYVAFSQNVNSTFDRAKFTLTTLDRTNSFSFENDDDGIFTTVPDINGKSAVLVITLGTARKQQVDGWSSAKILLVAQGGVSGAAGSTTTTTPGQFVPPTGTSTTIPTGTTPVGTSSVRALVEEEQVPSEVVIQSMEGTISVYNPTGNTVVAEEEEDETNTFDFDGNDTIESTVLMDIDGETSIVAINVIDADIIYTNLQYPLSVEKSGDNNYIIAQDNDITVANIGIDESTIWSISKNIVSFDWLRGGNATLLDDGSVLCTSPSMNKVLQIMPVTNAILFNYTPKFTPVYSVRRANGNTVIVESDELYNSLNSRILEIDSNQDVIKEWGLGRLMSPTGVYVLANNNWLISC